jgi:hypothetical protein
MDCRTCPECQHRREAGCLDTFTCALSGAEVRPAPTDFATASAIRDGEAPGLVCPRNLTRGDVTSAMALGVLLRARAIGKLNALLGYYPTATRRDLRYLMAR